MSVLVKWEFDKPRKYITCDYGLTFSGHLRALPDTKRIRYFYYPRRRELFIDISGDLPLTLSHRFHVERISKNHFRLTPVTHDFIVEPRRAIF